MTEIATEHLEVKAQLTATETGEISGLAWPFGTVDLVGDSITPGAFDKPASLPMLHDHDGGQTIGVWNEIVETPEGLSVKGRLLVNDVPRAREVADLIRSGEIGGLSIGFVTKSATRHAKGRNITALSLREVSLTNRPCNPGAHVVSLKSLINKESRMENEELTPEVKTTPANDAPVLDTKALAQVQARLDQLEAKAQRPGVTIVAPNLDTKAFVEFLQTGQIDRKALTNAADAAAGFVLAPKEIEAEFVRNLVEFSPVRSVADIRTTSSHTVIIPKRTGITNAVWVGETAARTASEPTFAQMEVGIKELGRVNT